jgi:hypothetical protein
MKLSEYAKKIGLTYDTVLDHFNKNMIPGAYRLPTGTIIVPDELGDGRGAVALDLAVDATADADGRSANRKPKTQQDVLRAQLEAMQAGTAANNPGFNPQDYMQASAILPKAAVKTRDYESEWQAALEKCTYKIDALVSNYIQDQAIRALPNVAVMIEEHAEKLCEMEFVAKTARETLFRLKEALDSGEPVERAYELQNTYSTQLQNSSNNRSKHLDNVERYWQAQAARLGIQDETAKLHEETQAAEVVEAAEEDQLYTADARTIGSTLTDIYKDILADDDFMNKYKVDKGDK